MAEGSRRDSDLRERVLEATNIVELIGRTVALKRARQGLRRALPLPPGKVPFVSRQPRSSSSSTASAARQHGNAIDFVIERDRVEFMDALRQLGRGGRTFEMPGAGRGGEKAGEQQILLDAQSAACMFFENQLSHPTEGAAAREYLRNRGFNAESIKRFQHRLGGRRLGRVAPQRRGARSSRRSSWRWRGWSNPATRATGSTTRSATA